MIGKQLKHYRVEQTLGKGGMGEVYRALDTKLQRHVALKVLPPEFTADKERRRRFLLEARAAGALTHPAIAQIYDVDEVDGVTFMAMELVEGRTVADLIAARELDVLGAIEISLQVGRGLAKAHEAGIVHRDIKSENIMLTPDGHAKLLDFGLAKLLEPETSGDPAEKETVTETRAGVVLGTVAYMSPEQARGQKIDHRSDLFSLGIVLYHMAAGQLPFSGNSPIDTLHAIVYEETRPITQIRTNLPSSLQRVISRCLRKRREDRYPDAGQFVDALEAVQTEIETGISQRVSFTERLRERLGSVRDLEPKQWGWIVLAAAGAGAFFYFIFTRWDLPLIITLAFFGWFAYRFVVNRPRRLAKRFVGRAKKLEEVRLIARQDRRLTVAVDRSVARVYVRINAAMDRMNGKWFPGDDFTVEIRADLSSEEERALLQGPGLMYVRKDVLDSET